MKSKKLLAYMFSMTLASSIILSGCNKEQSGNDKPTDKADADQYLNVLLGAEPQTLDPSKSYDIYSAGIHVNTMEALTRLESDENGNDIVKPGIAESWKQSDDGLTWTFKLRDAKWSDGEPITAEQFVYGITRTLDPNTASPMGYLLFPIKNGKNFNSGKAKAEELGIKATDKNTLVITLESPCAYFLNMTYFKIMEPQRSDLITKHGDKYGSESNTMAYNGPYKITDWTHDNKIELAKNPEYWDVKSVKLEKATMKVIKEESARMNELFNGSLDLAGVSSKEWITKLDATGEFSVKKGYSTSINYSFFNQENKYFKNAKIRKAFAVADDRAGSVSSLYRDLAEPCYAWVPPAVNIGTEEFRKSTNYTPVEQLIKENPDPKALLIEGLKEEGLDPDPSKHTITILQSGTSARAKEMAEFTQQTYNKSLGINMAIDFTEWAIFLQRTDDMDYELASMSVTADYNDPMTYFDMFMSTAPVVKTGWKNTKFDDIVEQAGKTVDQNKRKELFKEAEKIFIYDDAVVSPTAWGFKNTYVHNYVKNYMAPTFGSVDLKYTYTQGR
ncbi:MAG: peptide ABC transporter substrate-binding protein [Clostridium sp.]|uniref:peptide ABC transporter substrate-binding protein n=1 Tax=Clostridium sp. TaxID=1506 RepID=UPI003022C149